MTVPCQPDCGGTRRISFTVVDHATINQTSFDQKRHVIHPLIFGVFGQVRLWVFAFDFHQLKSDQFHVPFHARTMCRKEMMTIKKSPLPPGGGYWQGD